jgi:hypothetical protein
MMRVIIAGSRGIDNYATVCKAVADSGFDVSEVLSGLADGVDTLAIQYAEERSIPLKPFPANWSEYGRSAGYRRNVQMAQNADALVAIWDGKSRGTKHMIDIAKERGLKVHLHVEHQTPLRWLSHTLPNSNGI